MSLVIFLFLYYLAAGIGVSFGYHRLLSHRSFRAPRWLAYPAVVLGLPAGTPAQWAGNHRRHHAHTDRPGDPHSPHDLAGAGNSKLRAFWFAHTGWYLNSRKLLPSITYALAGPLRTIFDGYHRPRTNQHYNRYAPDILADPFYAWLGRRDVYFAALVLHTAIPALAAYLLGAWIGVAAWWILLTIVYNLGDAINSVTHLRGTRPFETIGRKHHLATNHAFLGFFAGGEGWHANHHMFPRSARFDLLPGQWDWVGALIDMMGRLGILSEVRRPGTDEIASRLRSSP